MHLPSVLGSSVCVRGGRSLAFGCSVCVRALRRDIPVFPSRSRCPSPATRSDTSGIFFLCSPESRDFLLSLRGRGPRASVSRVPSDPSEAPCPLHGEPRWLPEPLLRPSAGAARASGVTARCVRRRAPERDKPWTEHAQPDDDHPRPRKSHEEEKPRREESVKKKDGEEKSKPDTQDKTSRLFHPHPEPAKPAVQAPWSSTGSRGQKPFSQIRSLGWGREGAPRLRRPVRAPCTEAGGARVPCPGRARPASGPSDAGIQSLCRPKRPEFPPRAPSRNPYSGSERPWCFSGSLFCSGDYGAVPGTGRGPFPPCLTLSLSSADAACSHASDLLKTRTFFFSSIKSCLFKS